jgi:hypothetical protein
MRDRTSELMRAAGFLGLIDDERGRRSVGRGIALHLARILRASGV